MPQCGQAPAQLGWLLLLAWITCVSLGGCDSKKGEHSGSSAAPDSSQEKGSAQAPKGPAPEKPSEAAVSRALNPGKLPAYTGPTGTIYGEVTITGDAPPMMPIPLTPDCENLTAAGFYRPLFRKGPDGELADTLVTVTGYEGFVPPKSDMTRIEATDCKWNSRTYAATFGQHLDVTSKGTGAGHLPQLLGAKEGPLRMARPGGESIALYAQQPGHFQLVDASHLFMSADVFVLRYPTHGVTGEKGSYEISGIPPGDVSVHAFLPATGAKAEKNVKLKPGERRRVDFQLDYSAQSPKPPKSK